jgi:hypothetical protein
MTLLLNDSTQLEDKYNWERERKRSRRNKEREERNNWQRNPEREGERRSERKDEGNIKRSCFSHPQILPNPPEDINFLSFRITHKHTRAHARTHTHTHTHKPVHTHNQFIATQMRRAAVSVKTARQDTRLCTAAYVSGCVGADTSS